MFLSEDILNSYSGMKTVSTLKKKGGSSETSAPIYHTCCNAPNNPKLQITSPNHKLSPIRHIYILCNMQTRTGLPVTDKEFAQIVRPVGTTNANIFAGHVRR